MTPIQVLERCEDAFDFKGRKPMGLNTRQLFLDYLRRYTDEQLSALVDATLEECQFFPRIADFHKASKTLNIEVVFHKPVPTQGCKDCDGTGWVYVTMHHKLDGHAYPAVAPCACFPRPKYTPLNRRYDDSVPF